VLSGRGLCDGLITRPEESYRLWYVVVCDLETSWMRMPWPTAGLSRHKQINNPVELLFVYYLPNFVMVPVSYLHLVTLPTHSNKRESFLRRRIFGFVYVKTHIVLVTDRPPVRISVVTL